MGRHLKSTLMTSFACLALGTMATGCASTATGISQSSVMKLSSSQNLKVSAPKGTPLAVIRYPAYVESSAEGLGAIDERLADVHGGFVYVQVKAVQELWSRHCHGG